MQTKNATKKLTTAAILIALGVAISMFMPLRIVLDPASYTLASHVPIFLSMFISPTVAVSVSLGATLGFLLAVSHLLSFCVLLATLFLLLLAR